MNGEGRAEGARGYLDSLGAEKITRPSSNAAMKPKVEVPVLYAADDAFLEGTATAEDASRVRVQPKAGGAPVWMPRALTTCQASRSS